MPIITFPEIHSDFDILFLLIQINTKKISMSTVAADTVSVPKKQAKI